MCLIVPLQVKSVKNSRCIMETGRIVTSLIKNVRVGDYLICQQDLAIDKLPKNKAKLVRNALSKGI